MGTIQPNKSLRDKRMKFRIIINLNNNIRIIISSHSLKITINNLRIIILIISILKGTIINTPLRLLLELELDLPLKFKLRTVNLSLFQATLLITPQIQIQILLPPLNQELV